MNAVEVSAAEDEQNPGRSRIDRQVFSGIRTGRGLPVDTGTQIRSLGPLPTNEDIPLHAVRSHRLFCEHAVRELREYSRDDSGRARDGRF